MKNIAVQKGLSHVASYLKDAGYRVYEFDTSQKNHGDFFDGFDAVVFTGLNNNVMGIQNIKGNVPFIEASGRTPEEIKEAIERRLQ